MDEEARSPADARRELGETLMSAADDIRVVLRDRAATARVKIGSIWHDDVPIVTARLNENGEKVMHSLKENAVLLQEQATHALVRIGDDVRAGVPIFKERVASGAEGAVEEIRVKVNEIRERMPKPDGSFWSRLRRK